jgi:hypothetical protein
VSVKVSSWVWHEARYGDGSEISGNALVLLLALADIADDQGRCRFVDDEEGLKYDALGAKVRVDRRTIERLIPRLREEGLVEHVKGVKSRPNEFSIGVPWAKKSADKLSGNGVESETDSPTVVQDSPTTATTFPDNGDSRTSLSRIDVADVSTSKVATAGQRYAQPLCDVLATELRENDVKVPTPTPKRWLDAARLLVDADGREPHQAKALIEWACRDSFWRANILSMPTFRAQFDKLRLARERSGAKATTLNGARTQIEILRARKAAAERGEQKAVGA